MFKFKLKRAAALMCAGIMFCLAGCGNSTSVQQSSAAEETKADSSENETATTQAAAENSAEPTVVLPSVAGENGVTMLNGGIQLRWFNNAGFEMVLPSGKHIIVDPYLDSANVEPFPVEDIERCDYLLVSHVHVDHVADIRALEDKFGRFPIFVGQSTADVLFQEYDLDLRNMYICDDGFQYKFDDVTITAFTGRHTEAPNPTRRSESVKADSTNTGWWGNFEVMSYLIEASDGTEVLIWAGMTTEDQKYKYEDLRPDIAIMHLSPKSDAAIFADMVAAWNPKLVIPHHYDAIKAGVEQNPDQIDRNLTKEKQEMFITYDENNVAHFDEDAYVKYFNDAIVAACPTAQMLRIDHHKWYRFGFSYAEMAE